VAGIGTLQETIGVSGGALKNDRRALHDMSAKLNQLAGMAALQLTKGSKCAKEVTRVSCRSTSALDIGWGRL
jgi:hypothetical protein